MNEQQFLDALAKFAPAIREAFVRAIQDVTDNAVLAQVVKALEAGDADAAWRALGFQSSVFNGMLAQMTTVFEYGGVLSMSAFPKYTDGTMLRFDVRDARAEAWLRDQSSTLVTRIAEDARVNVRNTLTAGLEAGRNPRETALDIVGRYNVQAGHREGGVIGLGQREEMWSRSARQKLLTLDAGYFEMGLRDKRFDATVQAAINSGKPLSLETVDKLVTRYRDRALKFRGDNIGRTETMAALNRSEYESVRQALSQSSLPVAAAKKIWRSAHDGRVRHAHRLLHGVSVGIDEPFVSPDTGSRMMHPGDTSLGAKGEDVIECRCHAFYDVDFGYGVE